MMEISEKKAKQTFSPKDVSAHYPVEDVSLSKLGVYLLVISLALTIVSLINSTQADPSLDPENDNTTQFLRENQETIRNGSYNYGSNSQFWVIPSVVVDSWFAALDSGMLRYTYGNTYNNFCWKRKEIPENEILPSLFRASQLFIGVQVLIRATILFSLFHRLFLLLATLSLYSREKPMWFTTIPLAVINEAIHLIAIFIMFTIHIGQDYQYSQVSESALAVSLVTFVMKMFLLSTIKGRCKITLCRMGVAVVTIIIGRYIVENWKKFVAHNTCDQMVFSTVAFSEWLFVMMMLVSYALDLIDGRSLYITIDVAEETTFHSPAVKEIS